MSVSKVYVNQKDTIGDSVTVSKMEEVKASDYVPTSHRIFRASSRQEPSFFIIVDGLKQSDVPKEPRVKVVFPKGIALEQRAFRFDGKRYNEVVVVPEEMRIMKG